MPGKTVRHGPWLLGCWFSRQADVTTPTQHRCLSRFREMILSYSDVQRPSYPASLISRSIKFRIDEPHESTFRCVDFFKVFLANLRKGRHPRHNIFIIPSRICRLSPAVPTPDNSFSQGRKGPDFMYGQQTDCPTVSIFSLVAGSMDSGSLLFQIDRANLVRSPAFFSPPLKILARFSGKAASRATNPAVGYRTWSLYNAPDFLH
ncbi:uncharacterized protein BT62DRAFT_1003242 [Guyanagaster necrorhizus]|uniref:Uncharacterized protein n=1 Tax=Guyanagaster necrorhizus TaxID=856835 RepID=A0A9P7VXS6_9AGAR|nr:uncharacterized protein BT62DRAFT_1003242 [Guyanagaster necrorhizus MCA 3950]KAG7448527.1 hypothetical protein BT62DRAFT_1003242 [Guyanagaster necrorhizus MCA 3950]